jgi:glycerol-3-phosphate dehydrogenase
MTDTPVPYDVAIIGAGVVGCAIARHLALHSISVALVDAADDVGTGTSKANTAILHTGFDATPDTVESRLVARGYQLLSEFALQTGIPTEPLGALLIAWDEEQLAALPGLAAKAARNGYHHTRQLDPAELYRREPNLGPDALGALEVPGEAIICTWTTTLALATHAVRAGTHLYLNAPVSRIDVRNDAPTRLSAGDLTVEARYVVNAAGLRSDEINGLFGYDEFTIIPRRGELIVFDKLARDLVSHILLPVPTARGKGVLVAPTVYGNVLLGPTADDVDDKCDTATTAEGLAALKVKGSRLVPALLDEEITAAYSGLRAATEHGDYQIREHPEQRYVCVGGIRSTGLTASMGIAEYVTELLVGVGLALGEPVDVEPPRMANIGEATPRPYQQAERIAADPEYGHLICHCERVSRGEIRDALASPVGASTLDGLRRRTRATLGRCQGFYCGAAVRDLLEHGTGS